MTGKKQEKKTAKKEQAQAKKTNAKKADEKKPVKAEQGKKEVSEKKTEAKKTAVKEEKEKAVKTRAPLPIDKHAALKGYDFVIHPLITEKSINLIESENKLVFVVNKKANKVQVKKAVEDLYGVKVDKVNIVIDSKSRKKAFVKISKEFKAGEIATKLGVL